MKRFLIVLFLILSMVISITSCEHPQSNGIFENPEFAKFNDMFANEFSSYTITVFTTTPNGDMLNDKYSVTSVAGMTSVSFKTETLNEFVIEGDMISIPEGYKTVTEGYYASVDDLGAEFVAKYKVPNFNFSSSCLRSENITSTSLTANVISLVDFMGLDVNETEATVRVEYEENMPTLIEILYITELGNTVILTYTFQHLI